MSKESIPQEIIYLQVCSLLNHPVSPQMYFEIREKFPNYFIDENKTPFWKYVPELEDELYKSALEEMRNKPVLKYGKLSLDELKGIFKLRK